MADQQAAKVGKPPMMASDVNALVERWREEARAYRIKAAQDKTGQRTVAHCALAVQLDECAEQVEAELGRLHAELEKAQQERREPEDVAALRLKLGTELVNGLVARAEAAEAENRTLKDALTSACADAAFYGLKLSEAEAKLGEK